LGCVEGGGDMAQTINGLPGERKGRGRKGGALGLNRNRQTKSECEESSCENGSNFLLLMILESS